MNEPLVEALGTALCHSGFAANLTANSTCHLSNAWSGTFKRKKQQCIIMCMACRL